MDEKEIQNYLPNSFIFYLPKDIAVSYTHLRAHETVLDLVCRLLLEKKKYNHKPNPFHYQLQHITISIIVYTTHHI